MARTNQGTTTRATVFPTALGYMAIAWQDERLCRLTLGSRSPATAWRRLESELEPTRPDAFVKGLVKRLQTFAAGDREDSFLDVELDTTGMTEFRRRVTDLCRQIMPGQTRTYGELATLAGRPQAARAVGRVMASNPFPLIVPCHRVIAANGTLCGFSAPSGIDMKRRLLAPELALAH